jgi:hypothetical protein
MIAVVALGWSRIEPDRDHFRAKTAIRTWTVVRAKPA